MNNEELRMLIHDLKQPLTPILGYTDILLEEATKEQKKYLKIIKKNAEKLLEKINNLKK